jgi:hypothetical protein
VYYFSRFWRVPPNHSEAPMSGSRNHWDEVYAAKGETAVSWYQPHSCGRWK